MKQKKDIKSILVIRYRRVGDSILAMALIRTLKQTFPHAEIDFVLDRGIAPLFEGQPGINRVISFTHEEKHSFFTYVKKVRRIVSEKHYDAIIDMRSTIQTLWFSLFSLGTEFRIGRKKGYNRFIQNYRPDIPWDIDMVEQNIRFAAPLSVVTPVKASRDFSLTVEEGEKQSFRKVMKAAGVDFSRPVVLCAVATRIPGKVWDKERMKEVLRRIIEKYDAQLIFNFGGPVERDYVNSIWKEMGRDSHIFAGLEANSLPELKAMVANCDFFFGNEGGPRHLSQAVGVPSFAIYPPNIGKHIWLPENDGSHQGIGFADVEAKAPDAVDYASRFAAVTVDEVWTRLSPMLDKYLKK